MEILIPIPKRQRPVRTVLFDFDGTISTLRCGWESIMAPMMIEVLTAGNAGDPDALAKVSGQVADYIHSSAGIQTVFQMQWLADQVRAQGREPQDPWAYKQEYNSRLMQLVRDRRDAVIRDPAQADNWLMAGSRELLHALSARGVGLIVASGTDQADVQAEAGILGVAGFFTRIAGAPPREASCSKERVIRELLGIGRLDGADLAVVGDGKVEIRIAREVGAQALGVASDEEKRQGMNPVKQSRLTAAGAQALVGDFLELDAILAWLGMD